MKRFAKVILILTVALATLCLAAGLTACNQKSDDTLRFAAPVGTPALAMLRLAADGEKLGGYDVDYEVVAPALIAAEMTSEKADIVIMPINAGAAQIVNNGADYKLVGIAVQGSLFLVGHKEGGDAITVDDVKGKKVACIGKGAVPGLVFEYVMKKNGVDVIVEGTPTNEQVFVEYVGDASEAVTAYMREQAPVDYIVVGEPAATAQKSKVAKLNAEMDLQAEYAKFSTLEGVDNYPQAGLFVRTRLANNAEFMDSLFEALASNKQWVAAHPQDVTSVAQSINCNATFPPASVPRCAIDATKLSDVKKNAIIEFLKGIAPAVDWQGNSAKLF